jgi:hypothetical protein
MHVQPKQALLFQNNNTFEGRHEDESFDTEPEQTVEKAHDLQENQLGMNFGG